jgi:hypothetical protein
MNMNREIQITDEQRFLLNAGHGPPPVPYGPSMDLGIYSSPPSASLLHRNATCSDFGSRASNSPMFYGDGGYQRMLQNRSEVGEVQKMKEKDQHLLMLRNDPRFMPAHSGQRVFDDLMRDNDELQRRLTVKMNELESLRTKHERESANYQYLRNLVTSLPDVAVRLPQTNGPDDFIHLVANAGESNRGHSMTSGAEPNMDEFVSMTKSVQCSEPSMEQIADVKAETKEMELASPTVEKKGGAISSSSSSSSESFEVVGQGSCLGSPAAREDVKIQSVNMITQVEALTLKVSELTRRLEVVEEERKMEMAEHQQLKAKLDWVMRQMEENGKASAVIPTDRQQSEDQRQNLSELMSANWKLTEQNIELTRDNEELKKRALDWRSTMMNVNRLEEELEAKRRLIADLEAHIENMRFEQKGMACSGAASELENENALLKHQIDAYKEDFEVERKEREHLVAQKDTLQRCYDTLRSDLDVARQQLKKFESDITLLRIDNSTLRTKLRSVTEEVEALRDMHQSTTITPKASAPPAQNRTFVPQPVSQNAFALPKPAPPPSSGASSGDWQCQICTYQNPAPRTFCEMCGSHEPLRMSPAAQAPNRPYVPNIPSRETQWNGAKAATPLLSNLRNYGDIETD